MENEGRPAGAATGDGTKWPETRGPKFPEFPTCLIGSRSEDVSRMPEISRFFGIIVQMYYSDHEPPHFHVRHSGQKALIAIETLALLGGRLSPRALGLVTEWAALHRAELMEDWTLARSEAQLKPIAPLE
jgi:Domain of unknown function (DUF4160)